MTSQMQDKPKAKLMRLRCKFRPLHDAYFVGGKIVERDSDVEFQCQDGRVLKAHKIILASASKFFVELFENQKCGKMTTVCVPDIDSLTMQLILKLAYREKVSVSMKRIRDVGDYLNVFGMEWKNFSFIESKAETKGDINLGGPDENFPVRNPNELKRYPGPRDNLIPSSITPNKRPRFENPKEKPQPIQTTSSPSKKVVQQQKQLRQIVQELTTDNPESEKAIKNWINSLGKSDGQQDGIITVDQKPTTSNGNVQQQQTPPKYKQIVRQQEQRRASYYNDQTNVCDICNYTCEDEEKFKWHEDRHTGIMQFTCCFCPTVFDTERKIMAHEYNAHQFEPNFSTSQLHEPQTQISKSSAKPAANIRSTNKSPIKKEKLILVKTAHGHHYRKPVNYAKLAKHRSPRTQSKGDNIYARPKPPTLQKQVSNNVSSTSTISSPIPKPGTDSTGKILFKNKDIPLGEVEDREEKEVIAALKGIYWTYICDKCKQESESLQKAHDHYLQCCGDDIPEFVNSLHRFPLNYYGPIKCCRCFKRYALNSSFFLHCGHKHSELKKKFSVGNDDKILCGHCKGKFYDPQQFDEHLDEFENCPRGENSSFNKELEVGEIVGENPFEVSRRQRLAKWNNSRSRPNLTEKTAARNVKRPKLDPENEATFSAGQCPICGERDVAKIVEHIKTEHREFDFNIVQVSNMAMKCKTCNTSFAICDLLTHSCEASQRQKEPQQQQAKPAVTKTQTKVVPQGGDQEDFIPATGIGKSPIEVMDCSDLLNINTLREAFNCQFCGRKGKKLGFGAECLKTHNIHRCSLCFNTYSTKEDYSMHLKVCHGTGTGSRLYCPCCPKSRDYANAGQATAHMYSVHWLSIIRIIEGKVSISKHSGEIIDKKQPTTTRTRPAKNADKNESILDVTLGISNIFNETQGITDGNVKVKATEPEVVNDNDDKSEVKTQAVVNEDTEMNLEENGEGDQDQDESELLTTDEDDTDVEGEDLKNQNESSKEISTTTNQEKVNEK